jgi:hypothetical protein
MTGERPLRRRLGAWATWWVLLMSFWVVLDYSVATDELLAGAGAAALGAAQVTDPGRGKKFDTLINRRGL